ncbi:MAG: VacJ family lipoprotein [Syntrophobacteraceae bacterium]
MRSGKGFQIGAISFLVVIFLFSSLVTCTPGSNIAFATTEEAIGPEVSPAQAHQVYDPYEGFNRKVFKFNDVVYLRVLKPVAKAYSTVVPGRVRKSIDNGFHNLAFPSRFINSALQGKLRQAGTEMARFGVNSSIGIGGLFDVAQTKFGLSGHAADFGQTLGVWGAGPGPFLMMPILGASNGRDLVGSGPDRVMEPLIWIPADQWVRFVVSAERGLNSSPSALAHYEKLKADSLDPYVAMRDDYMRRRAHLIEKQ